MEPAGVSGTLTISDQRSYIKIETLLGENPTEIHSALNEIYGKFTPWANRFRGGCVNIDNNPIPGKD